MNVTSLYSPDEQSKDPMRYVRRVNDYLDELRRASPNVSVDTVRTHSERARLVARLTGALGGEAEKHTAALAAFNNLARELNPVLMAQAESGAALQAADGWLSDFPIYADMLLQFRMEQERLSKCAETVAQQTAGSGVPRYGEAVDRIKTDLGALKSELTAAAGRLSDIARLGAAVSGQGPELLAPLGRIRDALPKVVSGLSEVIGKPGSPMPSDLKQALKKFADQGVKADRAIQDAVNEVDVFGRRYKGIAEHRLWSIRTAMGPLVMQVPVTRLLSEQGRQFGDLRLQILGVIDRGERAQMESAVRKLREFMSQLDEIVEEIARTLTTLAERLVQIDAASKAFLDEVQAGLMKPQIDAIDQLVKEIEALPALKLGNVADEIKDDNALVIESGDKVRVVRFDEVWPVRQAISDPSGSTEEARRVFNGDAAISAALLALTRDKPFGAVVLTSYEPQDAARNPFMRPPPPTIPKEELTALRRRLEGSNFKVLDWDLAAENPVPPVVEDGLTPIYVFLPPAPPSPPNPFGGPPPKSFGPEQIQRIREVLTKDARAVFLTSWDVMTASPFGGGLSTRQYALADLLRDDWGLIVEPEYRITWIIPDPRRPNQVGVSVDRFELMTVNYFTEHPVGEPFRHSAVRLHNACPLSVSDRPPEGVHVAKILEIPASEEFMGASVRDLIAIFNELQSAPEGFVPRSRTERPGPFCVMAAATRDQGGRAVVCTAARSFTDPVVERPFMRPMPDGRLIAEPASVANLEMFINSLYWLLGEEKWIASGPPAAPTIRAIEPDRLVMLRTVTYGLWPALVFLPGFFIWLARRR